jgi:hypothetical protein
MQSKRQDNEMERKADSTSMGTVESIMMLNGLKYRIPMAVSSAVSRSFKREFAQQGAYTKGNTMVFDWNTGTNYVNPDTALLSFAFDLTIPASASGDREFQWSGSLGGAALFQEIRIISKNGVEVDRLQETALLSKIYVDYTVSEAGKQMLQMAQGYGDAVGVPEVLANATELTVPIQCVIPMKYLSGFFRPTIEGMLIPAGLASGLRIEIQLVSAPEIALVQEQGGVPTNYKITDPVILLETSSLNDPTQAALMQESNSSGLEYTFPSYYSTALTLPALGNISTQINKAVSQGTRMFLALQAPIAANPALEIAVDSYASLAGAAIDNYQFRVGQMYFPQQVVDKSTEKLVYAQAAFTSLRKLDYQPNQVGYDQYFGDWSLTERKRGKAIVATSLETSDRLNLSGLPLNNAATGEIRLKSGSSGAARGVLFLEFITVARTSGNRTQIKI